MNESQIVEAHLPCPSCPSSDAYAKYDDGHGFCFSCETYFPPENYDRNAGHVEPHQYTYEYLPWRGLSADTFRFYKSKTKVSSDGKPLSIGYQYPNGSYKVRDLGRKAFHTVGDIKKAGLFGRNLFDPGAYSSVTITEGEADALAIWQVTRLPAVSVHSASGGRSDCTHDRSWLDSFSRIYLALDNDAKGRLATADIAKLFNRDKLFHVKWNRHKDALGYLEAGEESELLSIWNNAKLYLPEHTISSLADFSSVLNKTVEPGIPYPFKTLQEMTYGIRPGELTLVTAPEGVGKTEFLHQLEYSICKRGDTRLASIFLEETPRRHLEALAGIHLRCPVHIPDSGCTPDQIQTAIREVLQEDDRLFLDTRFGSADVRELIDTIRFYVHGCGCRVVIIDHISMALGGSAGEDERKGLDLFFTEAEMMVKELDFALIVVSHINDFGQTRGSRWGGKVADVRFDLSRDINTNILNVTVSKNRNGLRAGFAGNYSFDPFTRQYKEIANDNDQGESLEQKAA